MSERNQVSVWGMRVLVGCQQVTLVSTFAAGSFDEYCESKMFICGNSIIGIAGDKVLEMTVYWHAAWELERPFGDPCIIRLEKASPLLGLVNS